MKIMSTYFFKTNINCLGCVNQIKPQLDRMEHDKSIERWHIDLNSPEYLLEVETNKLSPEEVKHLIREQGFDADFTKAPQAR
jgi:copper chaperone